MWSEVAKYAELLEQKDKVEQRQKIKERQEKMRLELQQQMEEKEKRKAGSSEEDKKIFERQQVEFQAWQEAEHAVIEEQKRIALEVRKEREIQTAVVKAMKEEEKKKRLVEADEAIERAREQDEKEQTAALNKKKLQKDALVNIMADWEKDRLSRKDEQRRKVEEEASKASEYNKILDEQAARNKRNIPVARTAKGEYKPPNKSERLQKERQQDERLMSLVRAADAKAAEAELQKAQAKNNERSLNQEFLFKQMTERESSRREQLDEFKREKDKCLAETAEFKDMEKQRLEQQRKKNIQHRMELEKQIESKKPPTRFQKRYNEDLMSAAEVAMNRNLLEDARFARLNYTGMSASSEVAAKTETTQLSIISF